MLASFTTKLALKKVGLSADTFNFSSLTTTTNNTDPAPAAAAPRRKRSSKEAPPPGTLPGLDEKDDTYGDRWPAWLSVRNLPLTVQPWLAPPPPPVPVAQVAQVGAMAPGDRDRKVTCGGGRQALVVFLRCVGCAFAQKTFLNLRALSNKYPGVTCIAVSHSSAAATQKWVDLLGGAWTVQVVIDEDRAVYSAWGLGLGSVWSVLNPNTQIQGWKEKGWLGQTVAASIARAAGNGNGSGNTNGAANGNSDTKSGGGGDALLHQTGGTAVIDAEGPMTVMGNKWQSSGAWAVDGTGTIVWGRRADRPDDVPDLQAGFKALGLA